MTGAYGVSTWTVFIATTGIILSAVYALNLYRAIVFGTIHNSKLAAIPDLEWREVAIFAPLVAATLVLGVYPKMIFSLTQTSVDHLATVYQAAIGG
jgi:NADH-quinone oxidoreductase subunit M